MIKSLTAINTIRVCCSTFFSALFVVIGAANVCACDNNTHSCCPSSKPTKSHCAEKTDQRLDVCINCDTASFFLSALSKDNLIDENHAKPPLANFHFAYNLIPSAKVNFVTSLLPVIGTKSNLLSDARAPPSFLS